MSNHTTPHRIVLCALLFVSLVACGPAPVVDEPEQSDQPIEAEDALPAATSWLQDRYPETVPGDDVQWQMESDQATVSESDTAAQGAELGAVAGDWRANVSESTTTEGHRYRLTLTHNLEGWYWEGTVDSATGAVTEDRPLVRLTEETALETATQFVTSSETFLYDGIDETLGLVAARAVSGQEYSWVFFFRFDSRSPGYGNRTGHTFTEVTTPHRVAIEVQKGDVVQATIDEAWDMLAQELRAGASVGDVPLPYDGPFRPVGPRASDRLANGGGCSSCG